MCSQPTQTTAAKDAYQGILEDLSDIAEYLREQGGGTIQSVEDYTRDCAGAVQEDASQYGSYEAYSRQYDALTGRKGA